MSRSALWRQESNVKERQRHADEVFQNAILEGRSRSQKGLIPIMKEDTFNLNPMLLQNLIKSPYFIKCCSKLQDWNMLVDEIYYELKHLEPWSQGKSPSPTFCILLRLFTLRCSEKQMTLMLDHVDSPYIRCVGFLFLRYVAPPSDLWGWYQPYLYDEEPVKIRANPSASESTVGEFVRGLLTELEYYGTRLPRLPVALEREVKVNLLAAEKVEERALSHLRNPELMRLFSTVGSKVRGLYGDDENPITWYDALVNRVVKVDDETGVQFSRPKFMVTFPEYGNTELISLGEIDIRVGDERYLGSSMNGCGVSRGEIGVYDRDRGQSQNRNGGHYRDYGNTSRRYEDRGRWRKRDRSRSRDRSPPRKYDSFPTESDLMSEVMRREREKSAAKGKAYGSRPPTFKDSLSGSNRLRESSLDHSRGSRNLNYAPNTKNHVIAEEQKDKKACDRKKTAEEIGASQEKKRKLMARYG